VVPSSAGSDLLEVLRQAEAKLLNLRGEMRVMAKKKKMTQGWGFYGVRRHAEPLGDVDPPCNGEGCRL